MTDDQATINPAKIRLGLALISVIFVTSLVLLIVVDDQIGRAIFFCIALVSLIRVGSLARWLKRQN